jgi:hypothetical protein
MSIIPPLEPNPNATFNQNVMADLQIIVAKLEMIEKHVASMAVSLQKIVQDVRVSGVPKPF